MRHVTTTPNPTSPYPPHIQAAISDYLASGPIIAVGVGLQCDKVDPSQHPIPVVYRSDGNWMWDNHARANIDRHHATIPDDFLTHILNTSAARSPAAPAAA